MDDVSTHTDEWAPVPLDIPPHWVQVDFEDVFENISLVRLKIPQKEYLSSGAIPIVDQSVNLIGGFTNDASKSIQSDCALIVFGDHTKCFKLVGFEFVPGADGVKVLKPIIIDVCFAYYACKALRLPDRGYSRHYAFLKKSKIPLAPLNEQHRIVSKIEELFSELDKGVESLEKAREQLKVYRQAVLKHAFEGNLTAKWREENQDKSGLENAGWQFVKLHEIAEINPRLDKSAYADELTVSFVPMLAVEAGTGVIDVSHVRPFHEVKKGYTHFQENDVLFAKITPCMENGKMAVVPLLKNKIGFGSTEFHVLRTSNRVSEQYIFYFVSSQLFRKNAEHNMTGAVGQRRVPATWLANEYVLLPPLPEQRIIVARIEKILSQITRLLKETDAQLIKTKLLRQSILKRAFSGKLVAQDSHDEPASMLLARIRATKKAKNQRQKL